MATLYPSITHHSERAHPPAIEVARGGKVILPFSYSPSFCQKFADTRRPGMKVADLIKSRKDVYSISEQMTVHEAARYLRERQVRAAGVVDSAGKLVGVVSQSDISDKVAAENKCPAWMHLNEIMSTNLIAVTPEIPLDE